MEPKIVHIVSCASSTPIKDVPWHEEQFMLKIDCNALPENAIEILAHTSQTPTTEEQSEDFMQAIAFLTDCYNQALTFVRYHETDREIAIYCLSESGILRAMSVANKIAEFLSSIGCATDVWHNELAIRGIQ